MCCSVIRSENRAVDIGSWSCIDKRFRKTEPKSNAWVPTPYHGDVRDGSYHHLRNCQEKHPLDHPIRIGEVTRQGSHVRNSLEGQLLSRPMVHLGLVSEQVCSCLVRYAVASESWKMNDLFMGPTTAFQRLDMSSIYWTVPVYRYIYHI